MRQQTAISYLTTGEAAHTLGVGLNTVKRWIARGELEGVRTPGGHWRIPAPALRRFMQAHGMEGGKGPGGRRRVLIVDDEERDRQLLAGLLKQSGLPLQVRCEGDGYAALLRIGAWRPHLLILDILMPGIDGLEVLRRLHGSDDLTAGMAVVVVTAAWDRPRIRRVAKEAGVKCLLPKPVEPGRLLAAVSAHLELPLTAASNWQ